MTAKSYQQQRYERTQVALYRVSQTRRLKQNALAARLRREGLISRLGPGTYCLTAAGSAWLHKHGLPEDFTYADTFADDVHADDELTCPKCGAADSVCIGQFDGRGPDEGSVIDIMRCGTCEIDFAGAKYRNTESALQATLEA